MATIKLGEEKFHGSTVLGTLLGVLALSAKVANTFNSRFGNEKVRYYIEENGKKEYFNNAESRDAEVQKRVHKS